MSQPLEPSGKFRFLLIATAFEGGLIVAAYLLGWALSVDPLENFELDASGALWGVLGTLPLFVLFVASYRHPYGKLEDIKSFLLDRLGPFLAACRWYELLYLGLLAGVSEEILFRGMLQPWLERSWGHLGGLVFSNLIFALAHWITDLYALLAGLTGLYLGLAMDVGDNRNLLIPTVIHSLYDFLAFLVVASSWRDQQARR